jgi:hypothetical protein
VVDKAEGVTTGRLAVYTRDMEKQRESPVVTQKTLLKRFPAVRREAQILAIDTTLEFQKSVATVLAKYKKLNRMLLQ